jgi:hypothetical protein
MTTTAAPSQPPTWDRPIVARGSRPIDPPESVRPLARPGRVPTVEEAIAAWLSARGFAPSTAAATHQHLESGRARGWRAQQGIQSGRWLDQNSFSFFDTEPATATCFETYHFPAGFQFPEPELWYPGPPPTRQKK